MDELLRLGDIELNSYDSELIKMQVENFRQKKMTMEEVAKYLLTHGKPYVKKEYIEPFIDSYGKKLDVIHSMQFILVFIQDNELTDLEFPLHPQEDKDGKLVVFKTYIPDDEMEINRLVEKFKSELPNIVADFIVKNCHDVSDHVMKQTFEILKSKYMYKEGKFQ